MELLLRQANCFGVNGSSPDGKERTRRRPASIGFLRFENAPFALRGDDDI
jgi:hypothetical protein